MAVDEVTSSALAGCVTANARNTAAEDRHSYLRRSSAIGLAAIASRAANQSRNRFTS